MLRQRLKERRAPHDVYTNSAYDLARRCSMRAPANLAGLEPFFCKREKDVRHT